MGISPEKSAKFSFLLSMPIIFGAGLLGVIDINSGELFTLPIIFTAILSSFLVGVLSLKILLMLLEKGKFYFFGIYCICIGIISILI
jgi:undecaprenyl-diphosphatase